MSKPRTLLDALAPTITVGLRGDVDPSVGAKLLLDTLGIPLPAPAAEPPEPDEPMAAARLAREIERQRVRDEREAAESAAWKRMQALQPPRRKKKTK